MSHALYYKVKLHPGRPRRRTGPAASEDGKGKPTAKGWGRSKGPGRKADRVGRQAACPAVPALPATWERVASPRVTAPYPVLSLLVLKERKRTETPKIIDLCAVFALN